MNFQKSVGPLFLAWRLVWRFKAMDWWITWYFNAAWRIGRRLLDIIRRRSEVCAQNIIIHLQNKNEYELSKICLEYSQIFWLYRHMQGSDRMEWGSFTGNSAASVFTVMCAADSVGADWSRIHTVPRRTTKLRKIATVSIGFVCCHFSHQIVGKSRSWPFGWAQQETSKIHFARGNGNSVNVTDWI